MNKHLPLFFLFLFFSLQSHAQEVFWLEDFDNGGATRWDVSGNHPTPAGITGLVYGVNNNFDYFTINDANTPELDGPIVVGQPIYAQGQFVQGRHYDCAAPNNLPNPFVNTGAVNNSLHLTAQAGCAGLIYAGTPGYDDWNCITLSGNDPVLTQTEQFAAYNSNIDATGKCNIKLTADFYLGGSANGQEAHSTILYSIDGGATWAIVEDNIANCFHTYAGTCNDWYRRTFVLPPDADNQPDLRIAFRWYEDGNTNNNTQDYALGASFNVDNLMLSACDKPNVDFTTDITNGCKGQTISLSSIINSNAGIYLNCFSVVPENCAVTNYNWNIPGATFVNGTTANDANPQIQFAANGTYTVELTASNCGGDSTVNKVSYITISDCAPIADFSADLLNVCTEPADKLDTVVFTDLSITNSTAISSWNWTFNPATVTFVNGTNATSQNPEVTFDAPGSYEVSLEVINSEGSDTEAKTTYIEAISCECATAGGGGAINLFFDDFESGGGNWSLNSSQPSLGTTVGNENNWVINNAYVGGGFFSAPTVPNQPAGISNGPNSNYLHIMSSQFSSFFGISNATINPSSIFQRSFVETNPINTSGQTGVSVSFWYLCVGNASLPNEGELFFSTDGGTTWTTIDNYNSVATWTQVSYTNAAFDNQADLRFGFLFTNTPQDFTFQLGMSVDDFSVDASGGGGGSSLTWEGTTSNDWHTASNWSTAAVPTASDDVLVPSAADLVGSFMPTISAAAVARNVCNFGTITMVGNNTLTIDEDLLNDGVMTTDNVDPNGDVVFANAASIYKGNGTLYDVDVEVTSSDLSLENDMTPRSLIVSTTGTVDLATHRLSINKNLTKTAGTFIAANGEIYLIDACGTCVDATSNASLSFNANQDFGNVYLNKTAGVVTELISNVNHSFASPKSLTIQSGILDANTNTVSGDGNLMMTGGEFQLAKCAAVLPELTGTYNLTAGQVTLDGVCDQDIRTAGGGGPIEYHDVEFTGTNIKTLDNGNLHVNNQLFLNLPTTLGNYVQTNTDTLYVFNASTAAVAHTGGHVVGNLGRDVNPSGRYLFDVGSANGTGDTYYEPMEIRANSLIGVSNLVASFDDNSPNPGTVNNVTFQTASGAIDTVKLTEDEGFWRVYENGSLIGGNYEVRVQPSNFWTFSKPWAQGYYALLKQDANGAPWDFINGGVRVNDSTTTAFTDFSNYALAYSDSVVQDLNLYVSLVEFNGEKREGANYLWWATEEELDHSHFELQRSINGMNFETIAEVQAAGNSATRENYNYWDYTPANGWNYYRLKSVDVNGNYKYSDLVALNNSRKEIQLALMPNPARDEVSFDFNGAVRGENLEIEIYDVNARLLMSELYEAGGDRIRSTVDISSLSAGVYFLHFRHLGLQKVAKLIVID
jgi:PKD repeat protein